MTKNLPFVLKSALLLVPSFLDSISRSRPGLMRAMRPERRDSLLILLPILLMSVSLQHGGVFCRLNGDWVRPLPVDELAKLSGLSRACVKRCLELLRKCGFIYSIQIKRRNPITGRFEVGPGLRAFTQKFWEALGLKIKFEKSVEWAKNHCNRRFMMPFKAIAVKAKNTFSSAKNLVKSVLGDLSPEGQRIKSNCDRILNMLRQKK